jgi:hypothetical protein
VREPLAAVRVLAGTEPPLPSQGLLVLDVPPPAEPAARARRTPPPAAAPTDPTAARRRAGTGPGAAAGTDDGLPDPAGWAGQFVQAAVEVAAGLRQPSQLSRWTTGPVRDALARRSTLNQRRAAPAARAPQRAVVRSVRASSPAPGIAEASAVVSDGARLRAVALRLEAFEGRWRVTALQIG